MIVKIAKKGNDDAIKIKVDMYSNFIINKKNKTIICSIDDYNSIITLELDKTDYEHIKILFGDYNVYRL